MDNAVYVVSTINNMDKMLFRKQANAWRYMLKMYLDLCPADDEVQMANALKSLLDDGYIDDVCYVDKSYFHD